MGGCVSSSARGDSPIAPLKQVPSRKRLGVDSKFSISPSVAEVDMMVDIPDPFKSNYKILECIYHKSYRKLYTAYSRDKREVIVEYTDLAVYFSSGRTEIDYFTRLDLLRDFQHQSIPRVLEFFDGKEINKIVFEMAPGKDLAYLLKAKGPPKISMLKPFMLALISAVQYLHNQGLVHQNLKPSSLILAGFSSFHNPSQLKVVGFNLIKKAPQLNPNVITESGSNSMPSPMPRDSQANNMFFNPGKDISPYSAPELSTNQFSFSADLYSIGAIIFALITGQPPALSNGKVIFGKDWQKNEIKELGLEEIVKSLLSLQSTDRPQLSELHNFFMQMK